jgi:DNA-binding IclR family transcriptional regulator
MLELLDLFTPAAPIWAAEDLIRYLGLSRSTGYRYIRALHSARLIAGVANGYYVLGERIIELDRQIRHYDPIYLAGGKVMKPLVEETGCSALLCTLYRDSVMCVREELAGNSPATLFSRGQ